MTAPKRRSDAKPESHQPEKRSKFSLHQDDTFDKVIIIIKN